MSFVWRLGRVYLDAIPDATTYNSRGLDAVAAHAFDEGAKAAHWADQYSGNVIVNPYRRTQEGESRHDRP